MPNVVLLMADEHTPFVSSVYAHPLARTPNMQRLAQRGTVFENAYCPSPLCLPSRSACVAGRHVHELQTYSNCLVNLRRDFPTYGRVLDEQGVYSAYIGCNFDVYDRPENLGFSETFTERLRQYPGDCNIGREVMVLEGAAARADDFGPRPEHEAFGRDLLVMDKALAWLHETAPRLDRPWTLSINLHAPHFPYHTTPSLWAQAVDGADLPAHGVEAASAEHPRTRELRRYYQTDAFTEAQVRGLRRGYLGAVEWVDGQLGRLMDAMKALGLERETVLIYASDHGAMRGEFGLWWKGSLHEPCARVPCVAAGPGFDQARRIATPVDLHDLHAAFFEATGAQRPADWQGTPLQRIGDEPDRVAFSEYHGQGVRGSSFLLRCGRWKLIWHADAPHQLFDLHADPAETCNLAEREPRALYEMEQRLRAICDPQRENERAETFIAEQLAAIEGGSAAPA